MNKNFKTWIVINALISVLLVYSLYTMNTEKSYPEVRELEASMLLRTNLNQTNLELITEKLGQTINNLAELFKQVDKNIDHVGELIGMSRELTKIVNDLADIKAGKVVARERIIYSKE